MKPQVILLRAALAAAVTTAALPIARAQAGRVPLLRPSQIGASTAHIMPGSSLPCTVSFHLWNGVILVPVIMGDGLPMAAAINTGLPISIVTPQLAAKRGMKPNGARQIDVLDQKITVANAPSQVVRLNQFAMGGVPFGVCDLMSALSSKPANDAPAVWLGASALEALCLTIDPVRSEIVFRKARSSIPGKVVKVPFILRDGRIWIEVVAADGQKFDAIVDTGAVATLLPAKVAATLQLQPETTLEMADRNGKPAKIGVSRLDQVTLGKLVVKDVPVLYVAEGDPQGISQDFAVIGNDFLFRHRVSIDFGRKEIAFEPLPQPKVKNEPKKDAKKDSKRADKADVNRDQPAKEIEPKPAVDPPADGGPPRTGAAAYPSAVVTKRA